MQGETLKHNYFNIACTMRSVKISS